MARFLRTSRGLINADRIEQITGAAGDPTRGRTRATLSDGEILLLDDRFDEIEKALLPVVAAAPGYKALFYYATGCDDDEPWVKRVPVVAWRIDKDVALPVTPDNDSIASNCTGWAVLMPDGRVVEPYMQTFPDEEAWRAEMAKDAEAQRKPRKPKLESASARSAT
jgi:hypothetical protein